MNLLGSGGSIPLSRGALGILESCHLGSSKYLRTLVNGFIDCEPNIHQEEDFHFHDLIVWRWTFGWPVGRALVQSGAGLLVGGESSSWA